ncbi:MAG: nitroreductase family protein [Myxococcota bacterium]
MSKQHTSGATNHGDPPFVPLVFDDVGVSDGMNRGHALFEELDARRSVRQFSDRPVPREMIACAIRAASTAPSGAHLQPWRFVAVSDPAIKHKIRVAAEVEERRNYETRMPEAWKEAVAPMGTTADKGYLEVVPWIVVVFAENYRLTESGERKKNYYVRESVGLAAGLFIAALHRMGLATLTHTPSPMRFLSEILGRPGNEQPFILFPIGYPAEGCMVPDLERKSLDEVSIWFESPDDHS